MPATRSVKTNHSKGKDPVRHTASYASSDDVIVISSDDEAPDNTAVSLRLAKQEIRSLKKQLNAKQSSSNLILLEQKNHHQANDRLSSPRHKKAEEEPQQLKVQIAKALADVAKLESNLRLEKEMRSTESSRITKLNKRAMAAEAENADLKALNEDLLRQIPSGSSKKSAQGVEELEDHILCEICQDRLWQPYTLVECGHTQCQSCLTDWFNTALTANPNHPRYECPKCRTRVRHKPIDNFMLKEVVRAISRAIDPANGSPPAPSRQQNGQGSWTKFFK